MLIEIYAIVVSCDMWQISPMSFRNGFVQFRASSGYIYLWWIYSCYYTVLTFESRHKKDWHPFPRESVDGGYLLHWLATKMVSSLKLSASVTVPLMECTFSPLLFLHCHRFSSFSLWEGCVVGDVEERKSQGETCQSMFTWKDRC